MLVAMIATSSTGDGRGSRSALGLGLVIASTAIVVLSALYVAVSAPPAAAWLEVMLLAAAVAGLGGCAVYWKAGRPGAARTEPPPAPRGPSNGADLAQRPDGPAASLTPPVDEVETLMDSFSRMLGTIERQSQEIDRYAVRLDSAYKEIESSSAQLKEFSFKDEVTGLYNRRFFSIRLEEEVSRYRRFNHPVSVVLLDLDGFKEINDELGHAAGDETLRGMAEILLRHSRGINVICRYGGDEFAILLVETSKGGARLYADRIRYVLPGFHFAHGRRVTASFGIASLPEDVTPAPDALIRAADEALYAAKRAGKNRVSVYEDIRALAPRGTPPSA